MGNLIAANRLVQQPWREYALTATQEQSRKIWQSFGIFLALAPYIDSYEWNTMQTLN